DLDRAVTPAGLAAAALDVEREPPGLVAARLRLRRLRVQRTDVVEQARIRGGGGPRGAADRGLVDVDHLVECLEAVHPAVRARLDTAARDAVRERLVHDLVDERALARPRDAGDADQLADGQLHVDRLEIVLGRALDTEPSRIVQAALGHRDAA